MTGGRSSRERRGRHAFRSGSRHGIGRRPDHGHAHRLAGRHHGRRGPGGDGRRRRRVEDEVREPVVVRRGRRVGGEGRLREGRRGHRQGRQPWLQLRQLRPDRLRLLRPRLVCAAPVRLQGGRHPVQHRERGLRTRRGRLQTVRFLQGQAPPRRHPRQRQPYGDLRRRRQGRDGRQQRARRGPRRRAGRPDRQGDLHPRLRQMGGDEGRLPPACERQVGRFEGRRHQRVHQVERGHLLPGQVDVCRRRIARSGRRQGQMLGRVRPGPMHPMGLRPKPHVRL